MKAIAFILAADGYCEVSIVIILGGVGVGVTSASADGGILVIMITAAVLITFDCRDGRDNDGGVQDY